MSVIVPLMTPITFTPVELKSSLTAVWEFNGNFNDSHASYHGSSFFSTITFTTGIFSQQCGIGYGTADYVALNGGSTAFASTVNLMGGCWFNRTDATYAHNLFGRYNGAGSNRLWYTRVLTDGTVQLVTYNSAQTAKILSTTETMPLGEWNHMFFARNGVNEYMYVNGKLGASWTTGHSVLDYSSAVDFYAFALEGSKSTTFKGKIQQLAYYNAFRTDHADIAATMYNNGSGLPFSQWT